jgi:hypothetical protein
MTEQLRWNPLPVAANSTVQIKSSRIGGFLCTATGTLTLVRNNEDGTTTTLINAMAVTAGQWTFIPFYLGRDGGSVTTASSAAGIVGV